MSSINSLLHKIVAKIKETKDLGELKRYQKLEYIDKLRQLKDTQIGKRCFVIGNGPSLKIDDLIRMEGEDCFACNRIYGLYNKTEWRPKYYCLQDVKVLEQTRDRLEFAVQNCELAFFPYNYRALLSPEVPNNTKVNLFYHRYVSVYSPDKVYPEGLMPFSEDITEGLFDGLSITYAMIQLAVYMGYKEIYLVGVDHNYKINNGIVDSASSYAEGIDPIDMKSQYPPELQLCEISFREARRVCERRGITIRNATRGGKLEVFERTSLDKVLGGK